MQFPGFCCSLFLFLKLNVAKHQADVKYAMLKTSWTKMCPIWRKTKIEYLLVLTTCDRHLCPYCNVWKCFDIDIYNLIRENRNSKSPPCLHLTWSEKSRAGIRKQTECLTSIILQTFDMNYLVTSRWCFVKCPHENIEMERLLKRC